MKQYLTTEMETFYWDLAKIHQQYWDEVNPAEQVAMVGQMLGALAVQGGLTYEQVTEAVLANMKMTYAKELKRIAN